MFPPPVVRADFALSRDSIFLQQPSTTTEKFLDNFHLEEENEGLVTISSLKLAAPGDLARYGKMRLTCVAQLMNLYRDTVEKDVSKK